MFLIFYDIKLEQRQYDMVNVLIVETNMYPLTLLSSVKVWIKWLLKKKDITHKLNCTRKKWIRGTPKRLKCTLLNLRLYKRILQMRTWWSCVRKASFIFRCLNFDQLKNIFLALVVRDVCTFWTHMLNFTWTHSDTKVSTILIAGTYPFFFQKWHFAFFLLFLLIYYIGIKGVQCHRITRSSKNSHHLARHKRKFWQIHIK